MSNQDVFVYDSYDVEIPKDIKRLKIANSIREIPDNLCADFQLLREVRMENNVSKIGNSAFANCESLETVILPDSLQRIGNNAFKDCTQLSTIEFCGGYSFSMGNQSFKNDKDISEFNGFENLREIGDSAFENCKNLKVDFKKFKEVECGKDAFKNTRKVINLSKMLNSIDNKVNDMDVKQSEHSFGE